MSLVSVGYSKPNNSDTVANASGVSFSDSDNGTGTLSVDQQLATSIAADLAEVANLPVARNVANLSVSLAAKSDLAQTDDTVLSKPQIIQPTANSREIIGYTAKAGDTVDSIAAAYGLSKDTIKWENRLTSDAIDVGKNLVILPVDGIKYTIKGSDTLDSIAEKYKANKDRIVAYNDLELTGFTADKTIVIPGGVLPEAERPGYVAPRPVYTSYATSYTTVNSAFANVSAGNGYAFGNCTWYAYERRAQLGRPIGSFWGNAATWAMYARSAGYLVNNTPAPGAVMQNGGGYGHVAVVESVAPNGDITITEMNYAGNFNRVTSRTVSAGQAAGYNYIH